VKRGKTGIYQRLLNKLETQHKLERTVVEVIIHVALSIQEPIPSIQPTQVKKLVKKLRKLAVEIQEAEDTGFLLAVVREQHEKRMTTRYVELQGSGMDESEMEEAKAIR